MAYTGESQTHTHIQRNKTKTEREQNKQNRTWGQCHGKTEQGSSLFMREQDGK